MKKMLLYGLLSLGFMPQLYATDLMDVYHQSLDNDPAFKAAYSNFLAQSEALPQAWAALLPQLSLNALAGRNSQTVDTGIFVVQQTYNGNQWKVSASQAVFNYQAWSQVQQAKASVKGALATFNNAAQDLILRTADTYFNLLFAKDTLSFAEVKLRANKRQLDQAQQRFNVGLDPITYVYEAQAAYDQSTAQVISAKNNLANQNQNLSKLTNHTYDHVSGLRNSSIPLITPEPNNADEWVSTGIKQNFNLNAAKYSLEAARSNIKAKTAGNWPVFSIQGNTTETHYETPPPVVASGSIASAGTAIVNNIFVPRRQALSNVAITMSFPIFQGGLVASQTRQAQYNFQTSSEQLEKIYRDVVVNSRIAFNTIIDGISKVKADRQTVHSQQNSLNSVQAQYEVGTRTMTDVVTAQQHLFEAQEQLAQDQYHLINAILYLKYLSGTLNVNDLEEVNAWLDTTRLNGLPPRDIDR
jgi:outer membrane protein